MNESEVKTLKMNLVKHKGWVLYFNIFLRHVHSLALLSVSFNVIFFFAFSNTVSLLTHKISQKFSQYLEMLASKCIIYPPRAGSTKKKERKKSQGQCKTGRSKKSFIMQLLV